MAADLLVFIRMLIFYNGRFLLCHKKQIWVYVQFFLLDTWSILSCTNVLQYSDFIVMVDLCICCSTYDKNVPAQFLMFLSHILI